MSSRLFGPETYDDFPTDFRVRQKELLEDLDHATEDFLDSGFGQNGTFYDCCKKPSFGKLQDAVMPLVNKYGLEKVASADLDAVYGIEIIQNLQLAHPQLIKEPLKVPRNSMDKNIIHIIILLLLSIVIAVIAHKISPETTTFIPVQPETNLGS